MVNVHYVSAIYDLSGTSLTNTVQAFKPFLNASLNMTLFTDGDLSALGEIPECIDVQTLARTNIISFQQGEETILPQHRNVAKDTLSYLQFVNAKPEFIQRASALHKEADVFVWIDADVLKVSVTHEQFLERLKKVHLATQLLPGKIIYPGCIPKEKINFDSLFASPIWRFCGGLLIVPRDLVFRFYELACEQLENCRKLGALTWDVNLWAAIEYKAPELFHWYSGDHNDSLLTVPVVPADKRIMFLTMIKNESRIIKRCIQSALAVSDAVCICDTGSTDNTVELLNEYTKTLPVPSKIYAGPEHAWKNFGHNRSQSFLAAVSFCKELGWDLENTYALVLDADMELRVFPSFNKHELRSLGYKIIQKSPSLEYYNTRFMKLSHPWRCTGVTHEYWDGANTDTITMDKIYIHDVGDGGCKADKFERDVRLLEEGLVEQPNNPRYLFYLAQSYKDNKQLDKAIELYKRRIEAGGWYEEIWYSMYMIMKLYAEKNMFPEMEMWGQKAYEYRKERSENLLYLVRHFKDRRQYWKAWHYWCIGAAIKKPEDLLFIETECYEKSFDAERAIIHDYVFPHKKRESLDYSLNFYNKFHDHYGYTNIQWFVQKLQAAVRPLNFPDQEGDYVATSTCIIPEADAANASPYRLNVRYVNYRIQPNGSYLMQDKGVLSGDNPVRTINYTTTMDANFVMNSPLTKMEVKQAPLQDSRIKGLEDVRIFRDSNGALKFFATSQDYSPGAKIGMVMGDYSPATASIDNIKPLGAPIPTDCEKNWIPYKGDRVIYGWCPFRIGRLDADNNLKIELTQDTPKFLSNMRGSSTLVEDGGFIWGITHCVMYQQPRKYYHMVVKIDAATDRLVAYSDPFFFCNNAIEYCLGFLRRGADYTAIVSQNDRAPVLVQFKDDALHWRSV